MPSYPFYPNLVTRSLVDKLPLIKLLIVLVQREIQERQSLEQIITQELNQNLIDLHNQLPAQQWNYYQRYIPRSNSLEAKCVDLEITKTKEKQQSFQDRAKLQEELRRLLREYLEAMQNLTLFK